MTTTSKQLTFCAGLTLAFIILKLTGFIHWSWWWILSPVWIPVAFGVIVLVVYNFLESRNNEKRKWKKRLDEIVEEARNLEKKSK